MKRLMLANFPPTVIITRCVLGEQKRGTLPSVLRNKNRAHVTKITDVVETCMRQKSVIGEGKMRIKNETEFTSRGNRRNRVTTSEKKSMIVDNLTEVKDPAREIQY